MTHDEEKNTEEPEPKPQAEPDNEPALKERVLHTRVPTVLEQELKELAKNLRVPVSNLVRTILQDALATAGALGRVAEGELRGAAEKLAQNRARLDAAAAAQGEALRASLRARDLDLPPIPEDWLTPGHKPGADAEPRAAAESAPAASPDPLEGVLGFQPLTLAVATKCAVCGTPLAVGDAAHLGVRVTPGPQIIIGPECVPGKKETK